MQAATISIVNANIVRDPESRFTPNGLTILKFTVAVNHRERDKDGQWSDVGNFYSCTIFGKQAESLIALRDEGKLAKDARVAVVGRLKPRPYESQGQRRLSLDVDANDVILISPPKDFEAQPQADEPDFSSIPF